MTPAAEKPLSPAERGTLAAILDPTQPNTLHPADLPAFLDRPQVRAAIEAHLRLMETRVRIQLAEASSLALGSLRAILEAKPDLKDPIARTEVRRAATSILRFRFPAPHHTPSTISAPPSPLPRPTAPMPTSASTTPGPRAGAPAPIHSIPARADVGHNPAHPPAHPRPVSPALPGRTPPAAPSFFPNPARTDRAAASAPADHARPASQLLARAGSADTG